MAIFDKIFFVWCAFWFGYDLTCIKTVLLDQNSSLLLKVFGVTIIVLGTFLQAYVAALTFKRINDRSY